MAFEIGKTYTDEDLLAEENAMVAPPSFEKGKSYSDDQLLSMSGGAQQKAEQPTFEPGKSYSDEQLMSFSQAQPEPITPELSGEPEPERESEFVRGVKRGTQQLQATAYGALGLAGQAVGADKIRDVGFEGYQRNIEEAKQFKGDVEQFTDIDWGSADSITDYISGTAGQLLPSIAESVVTAGIGAVAGGAAGAGAGAAPGAVLGFAGKTGVKKLLKNQVAKALKTKAYREIAKKQGSSAARKAANKAIGRKIGAGIGIIAGISPMEAGGMWGEDALKHGVEGANWMSASLLGLASGASELVAPGGRFARGVVGEAGAVFLKKLADPTGKKLLKRLGIEIPKSMAGEAGQEAFQSFLGKVNEKINDTTGDVSLTSKESLIDYLNSAAAGAVGGGLFGAAGAARTPGVDYNSPETTTEERNRIREKQGLPPLTQDEAIGAQIDAEMSSLDVEGEVAVEKRGAEIIDEFEAEGVPTTKRDEILGNKAVADSTMKKLVANEQLTPEEEVYRDELLAAKKDKAKEQKVLEKKAAEDAKKREEVLRASGYDPEVLDMSDDEYQALVESAVEKRGAEIIGEFEAEGVPTTKRDEILGNKAVADSTMKKLVANEQLTPEEEIYRDELLAAKKDKAKEQKALEKKAAEDAKKREEVLVAAGYDPKVLDMSDDEYQALVESEQKKADKKAGEKKPEKPEFKPDLKAAGEFAAEDVNRQAMEQAKAMGGISIESVKQMFSPETYKELSKPGIFTKKGQQIDDIATQLGYESANDLVDAWGKTPLKKEGVAEAVKEQQREFELAEEAQRKAPVQKQTPEDFKILSDGVRSGEYIMTDEEIESLPSLSVKQKADLLEANNEVIGRFSEQINAVVKDKKQADAITSLVKARAVSAGMNPSEYLKSRGIQVIADSTGIGTEAERQANKGAVDMSKEGQAIIHAFKSADVSTMVHELGHIFRRDLSGKELSAAEKWVGAKAGAKWSRKQEEKFARGWEKYITTGQAPNAELKGLFEKFKTWMLGVYKSLSHSDINVDISPEIRAVFDSLVAVDAEVKSKGLSQSDANVLFHSAYHGTPHEVDKFSTEKIGTGEGAQAFGYGLYFTDSKEIADFYRKKLSGSRMGATLDGEKYSIRMGDVFDDKGKPVSEVDYDIIHSMFASDFDKKEAEEDLRYRWEQSGRDMGKLDAAIEKMSRVKEPPKGKLYKVELAPKEDEYLLLDKELGEQSDKVKKALKEVRTDEFDLHPEDETDFEYGDEVYRRISRAFGEPNSKMKKVAKILGIDPYSEEFGNISNDKLASTYLHSLGIRGIKYLSGKSRAKGEGNYNYVIFSDEDVEITDVLMQAKQKQAKTTKVDSYKGKGLQSTGKRVTSEPGGAGDVLMQGGSLYSWGLQKAKDYDLKTFDDALEKFGEYRPGREIDVSGDSKKITITELYRNDDGEIVRQRPVEVLRGIDSSLFQDRWAQVLFETSIQQLLDHGASDREAVGLAMVFERPGSEGEYKFPVADDAYPRIFMQAAPLTPEQQDYMDTGGFGVRPKKTIKQRFDETRVLATDKLRQGIVDQFHSLRSILKDDTAWMMSHLTKSDTGVLMTAINQGMPVWEKSGAIDIKPGSKSLKEILAPLGENTDRFLAWVAANRAERLSAEDRENLFTDDQIAAGKTLNKGLEDVFNTARDEFESLGAGVTDIAVKTGLVNAAEAKQWEKEGFYVPFYRMLEDQTSGARGPSNIQALTNQKAYKKLKGGKSQLEDLLTNTLSNWNHLISAGLRNQAGKKALETAESMGLATQVPKALKSKNAIYVRDNGQEVWYEIDESPEGSLVLDSLMSLNYEGMNNVAMKSLRMFKRALTTGVTASPGFKIRNLIRDSLHAPAVSTASKNPLKNIAVGVKDRATMKRMEAGGGAFSQEGYIYGSDPDAIKRLVGVSRETILNTPGKIKRLWRKYENFGNMLENVNRVASFQKDIKAGKTLLEANFNSRDQMDFARSGSFPAVRMLAQTVPFFNARLQGLDKLGRSVMDKDQRRQFAQVVGMYSLASVALMLAMKDDKDYEEAEEWEKRTYHMFKIPGSDQMYRIPRPFEVGAIAFLTEQMTKTFIDENEDIKDLGSALSHTLTDTLAMNPVPQAFKPLIELYSNKSMFTGRDIETQAMKRLSKKERYQPWTSKTAQGFSSGMSALLPESVTLSPVQTQHLVRAYTGWAGAQILASTDFIVKKMTGQVDPETKISEYKWNPVESLSREKEGRSTKYVTKFYENMDILNREWADIQRYRETASGEKISAAVSKRARLRKRYNRISKRLSKLRKREKRIFVSKTMTATAKREAIAKLRKQKNNLTKRMVTLTDDYF